MFPPQEIKSLDAPNHEAMAIESLTLNHYHEICCWDLSHTRYISILTPVTVSPGAVISCSSGHQLEDLVEIAFLPDVEALPHDWLLSGAEGEVMEDGWTRYEYFIAVACSTLIMINSKNQHQRCSRHHFLAKPVGLPQRSLDQSSESHFQPPPDLVQFPRLW